MCQPTFPALLHYSANDLDQNWCRRDKRFTPGGITPGNGCSDISVGTARWFDPHFAFRGLVVNFDASNHIARVVSKRNIPRIMMRRHWSVRLLVVAQWMSGAASQVLIFPVYE